MSENRQLNDFGRNTGQALLDFELSIFEQLLINDFHLKRILKGGRN